MLLHYHGYRLTLRGARCCALRTRCRLARLRLPRLRGGCLATRGWTRQGTHRRRAVLSVANHTGTGQTRERAGVCGQSAGCTARPGEAALATAARTLTLSAQVTEAPRPRGTLATCAVAVPWRTPLVQAAGTRVCALARRPPSNSHLRSTRTSQGTNRIARACATRQGPRPSAHTPHCLQTFTSNKLRTSTCKRVTSTRRAHAPPPTKRAVTASTRKSSTLIRALRRHRERVATPQLPVRRDCPTITYRVPRESARPRTAVLAATPSSAPCGWRVRRVAHLFYFYSTMRGCDTRLHSRMIASASRRQRIISCGQPWGW